MNRKAGGRAHFCVMPRTSLPALLVLAAASSASADESINPYKENGDVSQECFTWAADGQCQLNPGHMLTQCKYSCWEWYNFRSKDPKLAEAAIDRSIDCYNWAAQGECSKNRESAGHIARCCILAFQPSMLSIRYLDRNLLRSKLHERTMSTVVQ